MIDAADARRPFLPGGGDFEAGVMWRSLVAAAALLLSTDLAAAQAENPSRQGQSTTPSAWDVLRRDASARGVGLSAVYDGEGLVNASGESGTGAAYLGALRLQLTVDGERLLGWPGATFFLKGLGTHGGHPSRLVGDAQGVSNLEAPAGWQLYEAWFQQNLLDNRVSALVGRYDINTEFYRLQSATLFLNSSFGVGPRILPERPREGPRSFPTPRWESASPSSRLGMSSFAPRSSTARRSTVRTGDIGCLRRETGCCWSGRPRSSAVRFPTAVPSAVDSGSGEAPGSRPYDGKLAVGGWYYTAKFDDLSEREPDGRPVRHRGSAGAYVLADELVHRSAAPSRRQVNVFAELGFGDSRVNRFGFYAGGGLLFSGLFPALENDELGLAVAIARNGSHFIELQRQNAVPVTGTETAVELTYLLQIGKHLALQPDLQYVMRPGTDPTRKTRWRWR